MKIYELQMKVYLLKSITMDNSYFEISKLIDLTMLKDEKYKFYHKKNCYKNYNFASFYPLEKNKVYKEGGLYTVKIRTIDENIKLFFEKELRNAYTQSIKVLTISSKMIKYKHIEELYNITPLVLKFDKGYWKKHESMDTFLERIKINLIKKYNYFNNEEINDDFEFITYARINNKKPISINYKDIKLLGDKVTLGISSNKLAQNLAAIALGCGLGEVNARGCGFTNFKEV